MKVFHVSWNDPETVLHEMLWKKNFTVYPSLKKKKSTYREPNICDIRPAYKEYKAM